MDDLRVETHHLETIEQVQVRSPKNSHVLGKLKKRRGEGRHLVVFLWGKVSLFFGGDWGGVDRSDKLEEAHELWNAFI